MEWWICWRSLKISILGTGFLPYHELVREHKWVMRNWKYVTCFMEIMFLCFSHLLMKSYFITMSEMIHSSGWPNLVVAWSAMPDHKRCSMECCGWVDPGAPGKPELIPWRGQREGWSLCWSICRLPVTLGNNFTSWPSKGHTFLRDLSLNQPCLLDCSQNKCSEISLSQCVI